MTVAIAGLLALGAGVLPLRAEEGTKDWGYDKGLFFKTDGFEMKVGARLQFRLTNTDPEGADPTREFRIRRAKFFGSGWAYKPWIKYKFQFNAVGNTTVTDLTGSTTKGFDLEDFYVDFAKNGMATVRVGQYKVPFGMQELTSSGSQQFVDRSIASETFAPGRDQGVVLMGDFVGQKLGYEAGFFNGNGRNQSSNDNNKFEYVARVHFDPRGHYKLEESATGNPDRLLWTIGAGWLQNATDAAGDLKQDSVEGFFALMYRRVSVIADYYRKSADQMGGGTLDSNGSIGQVGVFLIPKTLEVALRSSRVDPDTDTSDDTTTESRFAINWFIKAHHLKLQTDFGRITQQTVPGDVHTDEARAQLQIIF
ncbi:MAG TPA: porin [Candidatus Polarisedimenticolia bacterium]|nr:porin [Candidatus Polarisedimenticolia bacterium]